MSRKVEKSALQDAVALDFDEQDVLNQAKKDDLELSKLLQSTLSYCKINYAHVSYKDMLPKFNNLFPAKEGYAYAIYYYDTANKCICDLARVQNVRDFFDSVSDVDIQQTIQQYKAQNKKYPRYFLNPEDIRFIVSAKINVVSGETELINQFLGFTLWDCYNSDSQLFIINSREEEKQRLIEIAEKLKKSQEVKKD